MEQVRTEGPGESDRGQREELEQLQMELRQARSALARVGGGVAIAEAELQEALDAAKQRRDEAQARLTSLEAEEKRLRAEAHELDRQVQAKKEEDSLLARGAQLRDKYVDWNPDNRKPLPPWVEKVIFGGTGLVLVIELLLWLSGRL